MEDFGCQHVTGEDAEGFLTFCEAQVQQGSSYCQQHRRLKYVSMDQYEPELYVPRDTVSVRLKNPW